MKAFFAKHKIKNDVIAVGVVVVVVGGGGGILKAKKLLR